MHRLLFHVYRVLWRGYHLLPLPASCRTWIHDHILRRFWQNTTTPADDTCVKDDRAPQVMDIYQAQNAYPRLQDVSRAVTAVIPNYNYERYLNERIDSILFQTYPVQEIIILDDASTDGSVALIEDRIRNNHSGIPIRLIRNAENGGNVFAQWDRGFTYAQTPYVWIAEADDSCDSRFLETVMRGFEDEDVVISYCESLTIDENNVLLMPNLREWIDIFHCGKWNDDYVNDSVAEVAETMCINNTIANVSSAVIRKGDYRTILKEATTYRLAGDWYIYINILRHGKIAYSKESYNYHRMQTQGVTASTPREQEYREILRIQNYAIENYPVRPEAMDKIYARREGYRMQFGVREAQILPETAPGQSRWRLVNWYRTRRYFQQEYQEGDRKAAERCGTHALQPDQRYAFIFFAADHNNLGDIAITISQQRFLQEVLGDSYEVRRIYLGETYQWIADIKALPRENVLITLLGGGNNGSLYPLVETPRRYLLRTFRDYRIVSFPQSVYYEKDALAAAIRKEFGGVADRCRDLTLVAREQCSWQTYQQLTHVRALLTPDMGFYYARYVTGTPNREQNTVALILRDDKEKQLSTARQAEIIALCQDQFARVTTMDTCDVWNDRNNLEELLEDYIRQLQGVGLAITDRLHGMILCYITGTPCIVIANNHHKIRSTYDTWLQGQNIVRLYEPENHSVDDLARLIQEMRQGQNWTAVDLDAAFEPLRDVLRIGES